MTQKVQDSGDGISPETPGAIFDPYITNRNSRNNPEGVGIGLHVSKHIVENLRHGAITAYNSPPLGATPFILMADDHSMVRRGQGGHRRGHFANASSILTKQASVKDRFKMGY